MEYSGVSHRHIKLTWEALKGSGWHLIILLRVGELDSRRKMSLAIWSKPLIERDEAGLALCLVVERQAENRWWLQAWGWFLI
jgi:hypothetical protein